MDDVKEDTGMELTELKEALRDRTSWRRLTMTIIIVGNDLIDFRERERERERERDRQTDRQTDSERERRETMGKTEIRRIKVKH